MKQQLNSLKHLPGSIWRKIAASTSTPRVQLLGLVTMTALLSCSSVMADTFYSNASSGDPTLLTSWTNSANANPANFTSGDTFIILSGHTYTIPTAALIWTVNATTAGTAATVQINSGGTLRFTLGSSSNTKLVLGGNLVRNGSITGTATTSTGTIQFTSDGTWTGSGNLGTPKVNVQVDAGVTLDASGMSDDFELRNENTTQIIVDGTLNLGTHRVNGGSTSGSAQFHLNAGGTLITARTDATGVPGIFTAFNTGKITLDSAANYVFNGAGAQYTGTTANNATMPSTVNNLTVNNSAGLTLSQDTTVNGTLTLTAGKVTGNAILGSSATLSGGSSTAYINGQLTVPFTSPSGLSYTFPVGTASAYSPISLANFSDASGGTLTASATAAQHPNHATSGLDVSLYIARYWTLTGSGFTSPSYDFTGAYVAGDIQNGANPANLLLRKWDGGSWSAPASSSSVAYTVTGTGFTSFSDFAAGEAQTTMPIVDALTKSAITNTSATLGATVENDWSLPVSEYGIVWGTSPSPTTNNNKVIAGTSITPPSAYTANITGLPVATTIYYRGYAINSSGTGYSTNDSFLTLTNEPVAQASGVSMTARQNGDLYVSWTRGNGARCIVLVKQGSAVDADPVDGTSYTASGAYASGTDVGGGNYVAYLGTGTNVTITSLTAATTYHVAVYELNGSSGTENYLVPATTGSQTTVTSPVSLLTWNGNADTDWNNTNNWDLLQVPEVGTSAVIPSGTTYSPVYSNQMAAASFGNLTNNGVLNINTNGFNSGAVTMTASQFLVNEGGVANTTGGINLFSSAAVALAPGGTLTSSGTFTLSSGSTASAAVGYFTNNGGTLSVGGVSINANNASVSTSSRFVIAGGTNNLGVVNIRRSPGGAGAPPALGSDGLIISNGVVKMAGITLGDNAHGIIYLVDGLVTNNGTFTIQNATATRPARFVQTGGVFVNTNTVTMSGTADTVYAVMGGTNSVAGFVFSGTTILFTNNTKMLVGSAGISGSSLSIAALLNPGSSLGATADWTNSISLTMNGGSFDCQDANGTPHNIYSSGILTGSGALTKTGNGTLTLNAANTFGGNTLINAGTLALGSSGSLNNSSQIIVGGGATYDVSAVAGYTVPAGKTLGGIGTVAGNASLAATAILNPGTSTTKSNLTFLNNLTLNGAANFFDFIVTPSSPDNDMVTVVGELNISAGGNTVDVSGTGPAGSVYPLFKYGTLNGSLANISLTPGAAAIGYLTNDTSVTPNMIAFVVTKTVHSPTTVVWVGNASSNVWDALITTNWLIGGVTDYFINNDSAVFNDIGQANSNVVLNVAVQPASTTVNAAGDYILSGTGSIGGAGGLTKTNAGAFVVNTTNSYTGPTVINQGTLEIIKVADGGQNSSIGAATLDSANLVISGGTLKYSGPTASMNRGATLGDGGGTIGVSDSGATLTLSGTLNGSTLTKTGSGALVLTAANAYTNGTLIKNGVLRIDNASGAGSGVITNEGGTLRVNGTLVVNNALEFTNNSTIELENVGGGNVALRGAWSGNGYVTATFLTQNSSQVLSIGGEGAGGGNMDNFSGTIDFGANQGFVRLNNNSTFNYGSSNATFNLGTGSVSFSQRNGPTTTYLGALIGGPNTRLTGSRSDTHGLITYEIGGNNLSTTFAGTITNGNQSSDVAAITKVGTGRLTLTGTNVHTGATTINDGELQVNGAIQSSAVTVNAGKLSGTGTIGGSTTLNYGAILTAGVDGIGTLTFSGDLTLYPGSTNVFAVTSAGGASNSVAVQGTLYPSSSVIQVNSGSPLAAGTYTLFTYTGISGSFDPTPVFDVAPADTATIVDTGSQINLVIGTPVPPSFSSITTAGSDITLNATGGTPGGSVTVLSSTDLTLPLASWSIETTGNFDGSGNFTHTITGALTSGQPQKFYCLQIP